MQAGGASGRLGLVRKGQFGLALRTCAPVSPIRPTTHYTKVEDVCLCLVCVACTEDNVLCFFFVCIYVRFLDVANPCSAHVGLLRSPLAYRVGLWRLRGMRDLDVGQMFHTSKSTTKNELRKRRSPQSGGRQTPESEPESAPACPQM